MAKVIIITSREIDHYIIDKNNHLDYSNEYQKSFKKGSGIFEQITDDANLTEDIGIDEICAYIIADKTNNIFIPGVFKIERKDDDVVIYLAREYPYHEHNSENKYLYLDGLFEMIYKDLGEDISKYEIVVFSHKEDWSYPSGVLQNNQKRRIITMCTANRWSHLKRFLESQTSAFYLFEHAGYDIYFTKVKNIFNSLIG